MRRRRHVAESRSWTFARSLSRSSAMIAAGVSFAAMAVRCGCLGRSIGSAARGSATIGWLILGLEMISPCLGALGPQPAVVLFRPRVPRRRQIVNAGAGFTKQQQRRPVPNHRLRLLDWAYWRPAETVATPGIPAPWRWFASLPRRATCDRLRACRRGAAASSARATQARPPASWSPNPALHMHTSG